MPLEIGEPEEHVLDAAGLDLREHLLARTRVGCRPVPALHVGHSPSLTAKSLGKHRCRPNDLCQPRLRRLANVVPDFTCRPDGTEATLGASWLARSLPSLPSSPRSRSRR